MSERPGGSLVGHKSHNFVYSTVLCDGDAKTIATLNKEKVYEAEIIKEDCVNHVAKRMWKGIDTLKQQLKGTS